MYGWTCIEEAGDRIDLNRDIVELVNSTAAMQ